jgi:hypothetical protein
VLAGCTGAPSSVCLGKGFADNDVWVGLGTDGLYRIDPATGATTGPFASSAGFPVVVAGSGDTLWAADYLGTDVLRFDAARIR